MIYKVEDYHAQSISNEFENKINISSTNKSIQKFIKSNKAYSNIANQEKYMEIHILTKSFQEKHTIGPTLLYS